MKRKSIIALAVVLLLAFAVPVLAATAGLTDQQDQPVPDLQKQAHEVRKQMVDKYVEAGQLTREQGDAIKQQMDQNYEYRVNNGILPGSGLGWGGRGGRGGFGGGWSGCGVARPTGTGRGYVQQDSWTIPAESLNV